MHLGSDNADRNRGKARRGRCGQLHQSARVNSGSTVNLVTNQVRERLTKAIRKFLGNVLNGVVDRRDHGQRRERRVISIFPDRRGVRDEGRCDTISRVAFIRLRGVRAKRIVFEEDQLITTVNREIPTFRATDEGRLCLAGCLSRLIHIKDVLTVSREIGLYLH